jgi:cathepsin B
MKSTIAVLALAVASATAYTPAIHPDMVDEINSKQSSWEAHLSPRFEDKPIEHVQQLCGTFLDPEIVEKLPAKEDIHPVEVEFFGAMDIPSSFNAAEAFPECKNVIGHIRDQASCGSCWAFASTEAFNDRLCISSKGEFQTLLSPQDTVDCCGFFACQSMGCNGGQPGNAWKWFTRTGVVTGGDYTDIDAGSTCIPYQYVAGGSTPKISCQKSCSESGYTTPYAQDKHKASSAYALTSVEAMQRDIMQYGPISGAFVVYEDFPSYKSGVYHHTTGNQLGGHAIKIVGWGTEGGEDYWLVNNSWNTSWGINGQFKIRRGVDECGIETQAVHGGHVDA